ncbi:MAG: Brp/Blh family beta-carotene 15,15'-dioxygenase [Mycobacterium sp.]|nr:Brp/Blh family beta-carotene 15,15'-dioxygenase [Mycobacterium sp.]
MSGAADFASGWPTAPIPARVPSAVEPRWPTPGGPLGVAAAWSRWLIFGTVVLVGAHFAGLPAITGPVALVVAGLGFLAGVPHGAADHVMAARLSGGRSMVGIAAAYAGMAAAAWALLEWGGLPALIVVVALSAVHFGLGELEVCRQLTGWQPGRLVAIAIAIAGCGALVLPLARSGEQLTGVAAAISPGLAPLISGQPLEMTLAGMWLAAAVVAVVAAVWSGHVRVALDIVLVGALGMLAPPLVAFAAWFGGWHAIRHCARMLTVEPDCAALVSSGRNRAAVLRLIRLAALPSVAALTTVLALGWITVTASDPTVVVAEILRLLLALTVPHMVVVWWLDRATG